MNSGSLGAIPSRLSSSNRVQSDRNNQPLTPISLFYCGKCAGSFNRRLFSGELEGSEHCLSVCWGNTGPSQRRGSVSLPEHRSEAAPQLEPNFTCRPSFFLLYPCGEICRKERCFLMFYLMGFFHQVSKRISAGLQTRCLEEVMQQQKLKCRDKLSSAREERTRYLSNKERDLE